MLLARRVWFVELGEVGAAEEVVGTAASAMQIGTRNASMLVLDVWSGGALIWRGIALVTVV